MSEQRKRVTRIVLHDDKSDQWIRLEKVVHEISSVEFSEVKACLEEVERLVEAEQLYAVGFVAYEAAGCFDPGLVTHSWSTLPLFSFWLFDSFEVISLPDACSEHNHDLHWQPLITKEHYTQGFSKIKQHIHRGDTYQVNYTFPLESQKVIDPWDYFLHMIKAQEKSYGAFIDTPHYSICSASPELFFALDNDKIITKPMKGTCPRGLTLVEDHQLAQELISSVKTRAENIMITDMMRNDLAKIARQGTVTVEELCAVKRYPTLWQMISTITAKTDATVSDIFEALFPCSSITGAPKQSTMSIINEIEQYPRGIYTGAIGYIFPERRGQFNVAIRTAVFNKETGITTYHVGGGIVSDSCPEAEYEECRTKAKILSSPMPTFDLLETMLWTKEEGFFLLDYHLNRMKDSAEYFNFKFDNKVIRKRLLDNTSSFSRDRYKVRLLLSQPGDIVIQNFSIEEDTSDIPLHVTISSNSVDSSTVWLYHKTTHRKIYEDIKLKHDDYDDVILVNEKGQITECCNYNLILKLKGQLYTPPVSSGLLGGTFRSFLLDQNTIKESILTVQDLHDAEEIYAINSVRKWKKVKLKKDISPSKLVRSTSLDT